MKRAQIIQVPNGPIVVALLAGIVSAVWPTSFIGELSRSVAAAALLLWAFLEIIDGASWFRRGLGAAVMIFVLASLVVYFSAA